LVNVWHTTRVRRSIRDAQPEWLTTTPKEHNSMSSPRARTDEYFHLKYEEIDTDAGPSCRFAREELHADQEANADAHIHMPSPSYWPIV
jgi:cytochrome c oxidase subunit 1